MNLPSKRATLDEARASFAQVAASVHTAKAALDHNPISGGTAIDELEKSISNLRKLNDIIQEWEMPKEGYEESFEELSQSIKTIIQEYVDELRLRAEKAEDKLDFIEGTIRNGWTIPRYTDVDENPELPIPRLQLRCSSPNRGSYIWWYELAYRHLLGTVSYIPLGYTEVSGGGVAQWHGPLRDSAHAIHDGEHLNLPVFIIIGNESRPFTKEDR